MKCMYLYNHPDPTPKQGEMKEAIKDFQTEVLHPDMGA